jgi:prepilin-type N-terminal cleavage/methylation domain-containing protein
MNARTKKSGFSLTEVIVTMGIIGVLAGIGVPAVRQVMKSFESSSRVRDVVAAAFSNARARAMARGEYIGLRFQSDLEGNQYMVFIEEDSDDSGLANSFRAITGRNTIRLPKNGLVMDLRLGKNTFSPVPLSDKVIDTNDAIDEARELVDTTAFSVIFSPAGKLVQHVARIWNGAPDIFNDKVKVDDGEAMFYYDSYGILGLGVEVSRNNFIIVDKNEFKMVPPAERWDRYLQHLAENEIFYINPYTGEIFD